MNFGKVWMYLSIDPNTNIMAMLKFFSLGSILDKKMVISMYKIAP